MTHNAPLPPSVSGNTMPGYSLAARRRFAWLANAGAVCAGLLGAIGLLGWIVDNPALARGLDGLVTVKVYSAGSFVLLALCSFVRPRVGSALAGLVLIISLVTVIEYVARVDLHIDQLLVTDTGGGPHPGRMAFLTALALVLLSGARLLLGRRHASWSEAPAFAALLVAAVTLLGHAYGVRSVYDMDPLSSVALPSAIACALIAVATMAECPGGRLRWAVSGRDAGATLLRRLLPLALIGLPVLGFACLTAERAGMVSGRATLLLMVLVAAVAVSGLGGLAALTVARLDRRRITALAELTEFKNDLERQVGVRAAQLDSRRNQIAILEDRQRIAADLHDIVIQRLFAAGMNLQTTALRTEDEVVRERLAGSVQALDAAIKDLRGSIFELGRGAGRQGVALGEAVREICDESARILGFTPVTTIDELGGAADGIRDDVVAVLRESLSNVARHAGASRVEVSLRLAAGVFTLSVRDDGAGMARAMHSSGTRNLAERARRLGGTCEWTPIKPHGTQLLWRVPLSGTAARPSPVTRPPVTRPPAARPPATRPPAARPPAAVTELSVGDARPVDLTSRAAM